MEDEENKSFVFYESFLESMENLDDSEKGKMLLIIINYGIYGTEPKLDGFAQCFWNQVKYLIDSAKKRRRFHKEIGSKGGFSKANKNYSNATNIASDATQNRSSATQECSDATKNSSETYPNVNVNVNDNVNVNANDNAKTSTSTDGDKTKLTSDDVREHLQVMGYDVNPVSCGTIASLLNFHNFPLEYCEFVENKVSDRYPEISESLMVNALTTWLELVEEFKKQKKASEKKKAEKAAISECVTCGEKLGVMNWINGKYNAYFCTNCHTNYVRQNDGSWIPQDVV